MNYYEPTITVLSDTLEVVAPYNSDFKEKAHLLAGVYSDGKWRFSSRDQIAVRKLTEQIYGYDGLTTPPRIDASVRFNADVMSDPYQSIDVLSRPVARATKKPGVLMGHGIIVVGGTIHKSGSRVKIERGTELTFRDVPYSLYEREAAVPVDTYSIEQIKPEQMELERLFYEHDQICKRYRELEAIFEYSKVYPSFIKSYLEQGKAR